MVPTIVVLIVGIICGYFSYNRVKDKENKDKAVTQFWVMTLAGTFIIVLILSKTVFYREGEYYETDYYNGDDMQIHWVETDDSSLFERIGYAEDERILMCVFNDGDLYYYYKFPKSEWNKFRQADSKGSWFKKNIDGYYDYELMN